MQAGGDVYGSTEPLQPTPELPCATLGPVIASLTTLRKLAVHDIIIITPGELWRAVGCISGLQDLRLTFCQVCMPSLGKAYWSAPDSLVSQPFSTVSFCMIHLVLSSVSRIPIAVK